MPRDEVEISEVLLEDDLSTEPRQITVTPIVENGEETDFAVIEKKVDGAEKSTATENQTITLTDKGMYPDYRSFCGYEFDHWESASITISDTEKINSTLTFIDEQVSPLRLASAMQQSEISVLEMHVWG